MAKLKVASELIDTIIEDSVPKAVPKLVDPIIEQALPKICPILIDLFYPIGTYYETSDSNFNPNEQWGGTWVEDTPGRVTVSISPNEIEFNTIGKTDGEKTHILKIEEMPSHTHTAKAKPGAIAGNSAYLVDMYGDGAYSVNHYTGGTQPHNNLQPYIVVKRWHRTA